MTAKRIPIIANPAAGGGRGRRRALKTAKALEGVGIDPTIHWTERPGHGEALAAELGGEADVIVVSGGDGTIHQVVNGLGDCRAALAVAHAGRGNDLARVLGIPRGVSAFARMVAAGKRRRIDLGQATEKDGRRRRFCTVAGLGFDAEVARRVVAGGPVGGPGAYVYGILRTLFSYEPCPVRIEGEFGVFEDEVFLAATANTSMYGGGLIIAPEARPDDGLFSICLIRPVSRLQVLWLFRGVRSGAHIDHPAVSMHESPTLRITAPRPLQLFADGEPLATTPVTLEVLVDALDLIVP